MQRSQSKKRILVLPGGGATGITSIRVLQALEEKLARPITHLFDEIWASSVGSMIAAYLTEPLRPSNGVRTADQVGQLIRESFAGPWNALGSLQRLKKEIHPGVTLNDTVIPLKIMTAKIFGRLQRGNFLRDLRTEAIGLEREAFGSVSLVDAVAASSSVHPFFSPQRLRIQRENEEWVECIDAGCVQCSEPALDPTRLFLNEMSSRGSIPENGVQIFFISNGWARWKCAIPEGVEVFNFDLDYLSWLESAGTRSTGHFIATNLLGIGLAPPSFLDSLARDSLEGKNRELVERMLEELRGATNIR